MMIPTKNDIKTVTDLRENTLSLLNSLAKKNRPTIVMHRKSPKAVMMSIKAYNRIMEMIEDFLDERIAMDLEKEPYDPKNYTDEEDVLKELGIKL